MLRNVAEGRQVRRRRRRRRREVAGEEMEDR